MTVPSRFRVFAELNGAPADLSEPVAPSNVEGRSQTVGGAFSAASEEREYLIPTGKNLLVKDLYVACQDGTVDGWVSLIERAGGSDSVIVTSPCDPSQKLPVNQSFLGDGDRRIVLRRTQTPGPDPKLVLGFWIGEEDL